MPGRPVRSIQARDLSMATLMSHESKLRVFDPIHESGWDALIAGHPRASFFHSSNWARVLVATYGHMPHYLGVEREHQVRALLPILEVNSFLLGRRGVSLPFSDDSFDAITAISVVEHIGLPSCQVNGPTQPSVDEFGDGNAVKELIRVLKPGGTLIIAVPLGKSHKILGGDARCYSPETLHRLTGVGGRLTTVTYFEYQHRDSASYFDENEKYKPPVKPGLYLRIKRRLRRMFSAQAKPMVEDHIGAGVAANLPQLEDFSDEFGSGGWRERPITDVNALNENHIDGVAGIVLSK